MRQNNRCLIAALVIFLAPVVLIAQAPPGATAEGQGRGAFPAEGQGRGAFGRGGRGAGLPATPANVAFHNERNDARHDTFVEIAQAGNIDLLFVGDSITDWFYWGFGNGPARGGEVWESNFAELNPANFAIAGDTTQGVLWRMQNGELEGFEAKLIVLMLGTNNINRNPNEEIVDGNRLIIEEFRKRQPQAKVLLLGIFPRTAEADAPIRDTIREINAGLEKLADGEQVVYRDIGDAFLTEDGTLTTEVMADGLHPTAEGYRIWADAIMPTVQELMN
jgi:lysophospholipase L1-like esterase